jgi:hypothetical protein
MLRPILIEQRQLNRPPCNNEDRNYTPRGHTRRVAGQAHIFFAGSFTYMKGFAKYLGVAVTGLSLTLFAAAEDNAANANQLIAANAELQHDLNAQTAKQGDAVTAKLTQNVRLGGTTLPHNTLLIGHVDQVQSSENNGVSKIVLTFDQARLKNGQQIAIKATVTGVYPAGTLLVSPKLSPDLEIEQEPSSAHGFSLISKVQDSNSGTLSANGKNVRLTDGTELQFVLAPAAGAGASSGN